MPCDALHVNIQDASGDRILAGELLKKDPTSWKLWTDKRNYDREYQTLSREEPGRLEAQEEDAHVRHVLGEVRHNPRRKFPKGPKLRRGDAVDSCRIYGSLEGNKVQGDFHITARGHGYRDMGGHLDHSSMFSFSFFPPSLRTHTLSLPLSPLVIRVLAIEPRIRTNPSQHSTSPT